MFCTGKTAAKKRYERDVLWLMVVYVIFIVAAAWFVRHEGARHFFLYFWSVLPALPVIAVIIRMGQYLREETDEFQRWMTMQAVLAGTAALLATLLVADFLRAYAGTPPLPPFLSYFIFVGGMGVTQIAQRVRNRVQPDDQ